MKVPTITTEFYNGGTIKLMIRIIFKTLLNLYPYRRPNNLINYSSINTT